MVTEEIVKESKYSSKNTAWYRKKPQACFMRKIFFEDYLIVASRPERTFQYALEDWKEVKNRNWDQYK